MCKTPASECQALEQDIPVEEEEPVTSGDESEPPMSSGHSNMSDSSGDEWTDTDTDSASGHRVTPSMLIWHLMKEQGLISEERYQLMQENRVDTVSLEKVAPTILNYSSESDSDSYSFGTDDDDDEYDEGLDDESETEATDSKSNEPTNGAENNTFDENESEQVDIVEQNEHKDSEVVGDTLLGELMCHKELDNKQASEAMNSEDESINKGAKGDGLTNKTANARETCNLEAEASVSKAVDDQFQNKLDLVLEGENAEKKCRESNTNNNDKAIPNHETEITTSKTVDDEIENKFDIARAAEVAEGAEKNCNKLETNANDKDHKEIPKHEAATTIEEPVSADSKPIYEIAIEGRRTESFKNILKEMVNEKRILDDDLDVLDSYSGDLDNFNDCNRDTRKFGEPTELLREFALFLHFYSPSAYNYIRETFVTPLPDHKVLSSWYMHDDVNPGLLKKAFDIVKRKASGGRLYCTLMSDAVFLTNMGRNYDQVDFGGGCNYEYTDKAVMVFVLMLVGLEENWKIPIGYVRARKVPAETHAALIRVCLTQCHEAGADVVAVALDSPCPAEFLGCKFDDVRNLKTTFKHPECDREVAVWIDPCLAIRSIYNTLKSKSLIYLDDRKIRWNMIRRLRRLYSNDLLNYEESHSPSHLELRNHIAKVGLTSATLSDSLRPALSLCEKIFPRMYKNSSSTTDFIGAINNLYEILNSKLTLDSGYQRAMDVNSRDVLDILDAAKGFFVDIFTDVKNGLSRFDEDNFDSERVNRSFVDGKPACGFVIYLICIESLKHLYDTLVKSGQVTRLATHRLCKDHVKDCVRHMRRNEDVDPQDFTAFHFETYLKELFDVLEKNPRLSDRSVLLEYYPMENKCSPAEEIKFTSGKRAYDEDYRYWPKKLPKTTHEERATKIVCGLSVALDTESDQTSRKYMVAYLAGWIAAKFAKCLKCEECVDGLVSDKKLWFHKFITWRELSGVCLPSEELFRVCWECERVLKSGAPRPQARVLRRLLPRFPWASRRGAHHPLHHVHLVRAVVSKYIPLRVAVPLSKKETIRLTQMFGLIKCLHMWGFIEETGLERV